MRKIATLLMALPFLLGTFGCVSSYKHVLVSVVDAETGAPIPGAKVATLYHVESKLSRASRRTSEATTDNEGKAMLLANYLPIESVILQKRKNDLFSPSYRVSINNKNYHDYRGILPLYATDKALLERPPDFIPMEPDIVIQLLSEKSKDAQRGEARNEGLSNERKAEELLSNLKGTWPENISEEIGELLAHKCWFTATKTPAFTPEDRYQITKAVLGRSGNIYYKASEIRWVSPSMVIVESGFIRSGVYLSILQRDGKRWTVVAHYLWLIS